MRLAGVLLIALGVLLVVASIARVTTTFHQVARNSSMPREAEQQQIDAANLLSAWVRPLGGIALIAGVLLLIVGNRRQARRRVLEATDPARTSHDHHQAASKSPPSDLGTGG